jgi:serine protease Do
MMNLTKFSSTLFFVLSITGSIFCTRTTFDVAAAVARTPVETTANRVYARANPAVVTVRNNSGHGSGFIVSADGYVITNAHVVKGQPAVVTVMMADGKTEMPADVVGFATGGVDLALLKINRQVKLPTVAISNAKTLRVGDSVYAIGTPLGEVNQNTFTSGMVSAFREGGQVIQHNAAVNPGNSGGPLLNDLGEAIGVNTYIYTRNNGGSVGLSFAIGANTIRQFLADARQGKISPVATIDSK